MAVQVLERSAPVSAAKSLVHIVCCDTDRAMCGKDVAGEGWTTRAASCVVCADLTEGVCPRCGS